MNKKGTSLVELIAIIVIMGIIAGISTITVVSVVNRQRKNAVIAGINNIYESAKEMLIEVETDNYDENISLIDDDFCYISLTTMIESNIIDGYDFTPNSNEIYFCYNMRDSWVVIQEETPEKTMPDETGSAVVDKLEITFSFADNKFIPV